MRHSLLVLVLAISTAFLLKKYLFRTMSTETREGWRKALDALPSTPDNIPAFFFSHGSPFLIAHDDFKHPIGKEFGRPGALGQFLEDFGPALLKKYNPKGIIVFSAHWDTRGEVQVSDYGDVNPILYDYYGFPDYMYKKEFKSRGDSALSDKIFELYKKAGIPVRKITSNDTRGQDGRGFEGPGLDHGVFAPFKVMFNDALPDEIPLVQVSMDSKLTPEPNYQLGKAIIELRREGYLILSGGLIIHNIPHYFDFADWDKAVHKAVDIQDPKERKQNMEDLQNHPGYKGAPGLGKRPDHFIPLYIAAGAGEDGGVHTLCSHYGFATFAFGV